MRWSHLAACLTCVAAVIILPATALRAAQSSGERGQMRATFVQRVDAYVSLHRDLERLLPPEVITSDLDALVAPRIALNREIRRARASARQGDIFTPGVSVYFRVVIAETLERHGIAALLAATEDGNALQIPAGVNGDYPAGRSTPPLPPCLLAALPPLPPEVRYSLIGADLILWDMHAGLIVDFVPRALPSSTAPACGS
jgi:hypothetical protein